MAADLFDAEYGCDATYYGRHALVSSDGIDVRFLIERDYVGRHTIESLISRRLWPIYTEELQRKYGYGHTE